MVELNSFDKKALLKRANRHYFSTGLGDGAAYLARENMKYGLAKLHLTQEHYGLEPDATFITTPDETISRNVTRWKAGFGYGGKLTWGSGNDKIIILDTKPNACGMLIGGLEELPEPGHLIERIHDIKKETYIDNIKLDWDLYKGNHFIDVFKVVKRSLEVKLPNYAFIMHGSVAELREETEKGLGLYFDKSKTLREKAEIFDTKFGRFHVLIDSDADEYLNFYRYAEKFSHKKRELFAKEIFGDYELISDVNHQGLLNYNEILLGCQEIITDNNLIYPIALRADLPAFLMKGLPNLDEEIIELLGFEKRAEKLGVLDRLKNANILPHGGGYTFKDFISVLEVIEIKGQRYFILDMQSDVGNKICSDVRDMEFDYRGKGVVLRTVELGFGEIFARLIPHYVLKI
ncbi:MAG: hypothetical protein EAX96_15605 [Candidatus Lokiarchaeota archaeon]|nr:hypothetical protein [Candidatus Lokiarchaeota archaeon]